MDNFFREISDLTTNNSLTRIELERQKQNDNIEKIKTGINNIYNSIISSQNYKEQITEAASKGYNKCTIFEFSRDTKEEETNLPLIFIFKGPKFDNGQGYGLRFFKNIGVNSLLHRLNSEFYPFRLFLYFSPKSQMFKLDVIW